MASDVTTRCAWPGRGESLTELMSFMNFLVHSYTCCSDGHASPYWTFIRRWISMGFILSLLKKTDDRKLLFFGACCKRGRHLYTTTAPSCCIPASHCHLSATLQTTSIIVANVQDNRTVFRNFMAILMFHLTLPRITSSHAVLQYAIKVQNLWSNNFQKALLNGDTLAVQIFPFALAFITASN